MSSLSHFVLIRKVHYNWNNHLWGVSGLSQTKNSPRSGSFIFDPDIGLFLVWYNPDFLLSDCSLIKMPINQIIIWWGSCSGVSPLLNQSPFVICTHHPLNQILIDDIIERSLDSANHYEGQAPRVWMAFLLNPILLGPRWFMNSSEQRVASIQLVLNIAFQYVGV